MHGSSVGERNHGRAVTKMRLLVAGVARSGTSWLGLALSRGPGIRYYHEPDHIGGALGDATAGARPDFFSYPIIDPGQGDTPFAPVWDMVFAGTFPFSRGGRQRLRPIARAARRLPPAVRDRLTRRAAALSGAMPGRPAGIVAKSVHSAFALEWLAARYGPQVTIIHRDPRSVIASWRHLGMPLYDLATRPAIRERYLEPLAVAPPARDATPLARTAWHVALLAQVVGDAASRHPEWRAVSHDELCQDPIGGIRALHAELGLAWTADAERFLAESDRQGDGMETRRISSEQPGSWRRRLSDADLDEITEVLNRFPRRGWVVQPVSAGPSSAAAS